jgi:hypothetical protein
MVMKRLFACAWLLAACNKPSADDCRKALTNMQHLLGTENLSKTADYEGEVRRCKGGSSKEAVQCAITAQTLDDLKKCGFYKDTERIEKQDKSDKPESGSGSGS